MNIWNAQTEAMALPQPQPRMTPPCRLARVKIRRSCRTRPPRITGSVRLLEGWWWGGWASPKRAVYGTASGEP
jgi:hypothetical protein